MDLQDCIQHLKNFLIVVTGGHPQVSTELLMMSRLEIKMEPIMVDQVIHPWAEYQMIKVEQVSSAYNRQKALPDSMQASHTAQQGNQQMGNQALLTNYQAAEMITNAGTQQQRVHNFGTATFLDANAMPRNLQATIQNNESTPYLEYAPETPTS